MDSNVSPKPTTPEVKTPATLSAESSPGNSSNKIKYVLIAVLVLFLLTIIGGAYYLGMARQQSIFQKPNNVITPTAKPSSKVCTQEAKQCPDGSYVSKTGPECEFSPCPTLAITKESAATLKYSSTKAGISFYYPKLWSVKEEFNAPNSNFIDIKNEENSISIRIEYLEGEMGGRGGSCVKRQINYKANIIDGKLSLIKEKDTIENEKQFGYCGGEQGEYLNGYALYCSFEQNKTGFFIYSTGQNNNNTEEAIKSYEEIVSSINFLN